jgi:hypothetical protein
MRWLAGMRTRNGTSRAVRVALCGRPVACVRDGDWLPSWQHLYCRDRGCPACAQHRSRRLARQIREGVELRRELGAVALSFTTLTQPRIEGERLSDALARFETAWQALRRRPDFHAVAGGLRVIEVVHSSRGWHVHAHCIVELLRTSARVACPTCDGVALVPRKTVDGWKMQACRSCSSSTQKGDGTMSADCATLVRAWADIAGCRVDGKLTTAGQCSVPLDDANAGQLAKYISKLWELDDASAVELFEAMAGKRLAQTWGSWYGSVRLSPRKVEGRQWYRGPLLADIEAMHPRSYIDFSANVPTKFFPVTAEWQTATRLAGVARRFSEVRGSIPPHLLCKLEAPTMDTGPPRKGVRRKRPRPLRELALLRARSARAWRPILDVHRCTAGAFLRALRADDRRADEHDLAPLDTPTPAADALRRAGRLGGAWSERRRTWTRVLEDRAHEGA